MLLRFTSLIKLSKSKHNSLRAIGDLLSQSILLVYSAAGPYPHKIYAVAILRCLVP